MGQASPAYRSCLKYLRRIATGLCSRHGFCQSLPQLCLQGDTFIIIDVFALPVEGTETRVNAQEEAYEYMFQYLETNKARQALRPQLQRTPAMLARCQPLKCACDSCSTDLRGELSKLLLPAGCCSGGWQPQPSCPCAAP